MENPRSADGLHDHPIDSPDVTAERLHTARASVEREPTKSLPSDRALAPDPLTGRHNVAWVRLSDLISSGSGRIAGRGIDFEAELARRLRRSPDVTRRAIRDRSAALPPLDAFGRSQRSAGRDGFGRA
jgi:hypothetical protein